MGRKMENALAKLFRMVELAGIEPATSSLRTMRSPRTSERLLNNLREIVH